MTEPVDRSRRLQVYHTDELVVSFDPAVCIHSGVCLRTLPAVFNVAERRWIRLEGAPADEIVAAVARCPSGALQAVRAGQAPVRGAPPSTVVIEALPDGPLRVTGAVVIRKEGGEEVSREKVSLCRCGHTANPPFCDASHRRIGFKSPRPPA